MIEIVLSCLTPKQQGALINKIKESSVFEIQKKNMII